MQAVLDLWTLELTLYFSSAVSVLRGAVTPGALFAGAGTAALLVGLIWAAIAQARQIWWFLLPFLTAFVAPLVFYLAYGLFRDIGFFIALFLMLAGVFALIALAIDRARPKGPAIALCVFAFTFTIFGSGLGLLMSGQV